MSLAENIDAACAAIIDRGGTPDAIEMSQETYDARYPEIVDAVGFDPPSYYYYLGVTQLMINIVPEVPPMVIRIGGTMRTYQNVGF